jgi:hypothetical protein
MRDAPARAAAGYASVRYYYRSSKLVALYRRYRVLGYIRTATTARQSRQYSAMGVVRLYHWVEKERGGRSASQWSGAASLEGRLATMGAHRTGLWRLHCSVFSLKHPGSATSGSTSAADGGGAAPLFLLKSEGHTFALHNQRLLQGGPELQHILLQAMTVKGGPPLKPRLTGSIVRTCSARGTHRPPSDMMCTCRRTAIGSG